MSLAAPPPAGHDPALYGPSLPQVATAGLGPCIDAAVSGHRLYVIGRQRLSVCDVSQPKQPRLLGRLEGLGNNRQIVVRGTLAYITAREDGLFIVDVADAAAPRLLCHYHTIELATGLDVAGPIAYVGCRNYGVELVDVRDPARPRHLSTVRTGEAQSCVARDGLLYVGVWGSREMVVCDVRNPRRPTVLSKTPLAGFGDGVFVRGQTCFAETGHHRGVGRPDGEGDPRYGMGHGLDLVDISDPAHPRAIARVQLPRLYRLRVDMWDVMVSGQYAFLGDNHNGLFVVDISDQAKPRPVAHHRLPYVAKQEDYAPIGGFDLGQGVIYAAGIWTDLHVIDAPMARPVVPEPDSPPAIPAATPPRHDGFRSYRPDGQVNAVTCRDDYAWVACGSAGVHQVRLWPEFERLAVQPTEGFAVDVKQRDDRLYVAESRGGLSIWRIDARGGALTRLGRFTVPGKSVKQVVVPANSPLALLDVGAATLLVLDVTDPAQPREVFRDERLGLFYGYNITEGLFENRYAAAMWHHTGIYWFDLTGGPKPVFSGDQIAAHMNTANGLAIMANGQDGLLTEPQGSYTIVRRTDHRPLSEQTHYRIPGHPLNGKPVIAGHTLYLTDRPNGQVTVVDITDVRQPKLLDQFTIEGNPCLMVEHRGHAVLPAGYDGLWISREPVRR